MKNIFWILLLSATPIIEQRGSIPVGFALGLNPFVVFLLGLLGSLLPVPFILLFFEKIYAWLSKYPFFARIINIIDRKIAKNRDKFDKYQELALITFIAIPLPTTGLWTGSAIAAFLKLDFKRSLICAVVGGTISAAIITSLMLFVPNLLQAKFL